VVSIFGSHNVVKVGSSFVDTNGTTHGLFLVINDVANNVTNENLSRYLGENPTPMKFLVGYH